MDIGITIWILQNISWELTKLEETCYGFDKEDIQQIHTQITRLLSKYEEEED